MTFILRIVLILLLFAFIVYVLKAITRLSFRLRGTIKDVQKIRERMGGRPVVSSEMVRCLGCGAFVSYRDALTFSSGTIARTYCSRECMLAHTAK